MYRLLVKRARYGIAIFSGLVIIILLAGHQETIITEDTEDTLVARQQTEAQDRAREQQHGVCSQTTRKEYVNSLCALRDPQYDGKSKPNPRFIIDKKHNIAYCYIYKASSTSWIQTMLVANGVKSRDQLETSMFAHPIGEDAHYPNVLANTGMTREHYDHTKHSNLTKFIAVRHPFDRLLSAYYQKIAIDVDRYFRPLRSVLRMMYANETGTSRQKRRRPNYREKRLPGASQTDYAPISFRAFIDFIIDEHSGGFRSGMLQEGHKEHFISYFTLCNPCHIHYDVILRTETSQFDAFHVLSLLNLTNDFMMNMKFNVAPQRRYVNSWHKQLPEFKSLTDRQMTELLNIYKHDLKLFGYSFDTREMETSCSIHDSVSNCC